MKIFIKNPGFYKFIGKQALKMPYYFVLASKPIQYLKHKRYLDQYKSHRTNLTPPQKRILTDLKENGIAFTHVNEFFNDENALRNLQQAADTSIQNNTFKTAKDFLEFFLRNYGDPIDLNDPTVTYLLHPNILEVAGAYFQMYARLTFFSGNTALPQPNSTPKKSQCWHRDGGLQKLCKVFIYLNDVDIESGPFTYITGTHPTGPWRNILPHRFFGNGSYYPSDKKIALTLRKNGIEKNMIQCVGKAGTMIFCDTLGLHKGGYATAKKRIMLTGEYEYKPLPMRLEHKFSPTPDLAKKIATLHPLAQYAIKNE